MAHRYKVLTLLLIVTVMVLIIGMEAVAVGVRPLKLDLTVRPGREAQFELTFTPSNSEEQVKLSLYSLTQGRDGGLVFKQASEHQFPAHDWIHLEQTELIVYPGEEKTIRGTIQVPFSAGGSYPVIIMVEPQTPVNREGVTFLVRYAVRLNIRVERPGLRQEAELLEVSLTPNQTGKPAVKAVIENPSRWDFLLSGEATLRDSQRRLVERIPLKTPMGMNSEQTGLRIYPGSTVELSGEITRFLSPGKYSLRVFFRFGDHGQIIESKQITVAEGDFSYPEPMRAVSVDPGRIAINLRAGQQKSEVLLVSNERGEMKKVVLSGRNVRDDFPYSLLEWIQLRTPAGFELPPRGQKRAILSLNVPRNISNGSYHGILVFAAYASDGELIETQEVPLSILVGNEYQPEVSIRSLYYSLSDGGQAELSLDLDNTGNVIIKPRAEVILTNEKGEFVARSVLTLPEDATGILPLTGGQLSGPIDELRPGIYKATITIQNEGADLTTKGMTLEVPGHNRP